MLTEPEFHKRLAILLDDADISNECILAFYLAHWTGAIPTSHMGLHEAIVWG